MDLKKIRTGLKMTQADVAIKVGVSLTAYQLWERGLNKPTEENMIKLMKALNIK